MGAMPGSAVQRMQLGEIGRLTLDAAFETVLRSDQ
jgi:hypothetical protein